MKKEGGKVVKATVLKQLNNLTSDLSFRTPAYPLAYIFPSSNLTLSSNTKPSRQMTDKMKDQQQAGKHFFMSMIKPSKGRRIKSHSKIWPKQKNNFDFNYASRGVGAQGQSGLGKTVLV